MINIKRERFVVMNDKNEIFCGLARAYRFTPINDIGNSAIKTYATEKRAITSFLSSWRHSEKEDFETGKYKVVKVTESIYEIE